VTDAARSLAVAEFINRPGLRAVLAAVPRARLVGGCVRDALAGRAVSDIDLATPDTPDEVTDLLAKAGLRAIPTGLAHGTVTAVAEGEGYEITTLRHDRETDGRHAVVEFTDDWEADAARRDFTINAMSMTPDGAVFDYFGGTADLAAGLVRFVGNAATRIEEDYLRVLRFFRFFARYGRGAPDAGAMQAIASHLDGLARLSAERVWSELKRILAAPRPDASLALMAHSGVLAVILPEARLTQTEFLPPDPLLRLAALLQGSTTVVATRLKLSGDEAETLAALRGPAPPVGCDDASLRRLLADTDPAILAGRARLARRDPAEVARIEITPAPVFPLQGRDLLQQGIAAGPVIGQELKRLRELWLASGCTADRASLLAQLAATPGA